jgi:hypothetical protein
MRHLSQPPPVIGEHEDTVKCCIPHLLTIALKRRVPALYYEAGGSSSNVL